MTDTRFRAARLLAAALPLLLLGLAAAPARAQDPQPDTVRADRVQRTVPPDSAQARRDTAENLRVSPRSAFFHSLLVPGWGQSQLGSPGRGGIYFALEAGSVWMLIKSDRKLREARERQQVLRETGQLEPDRKTALVRERENQKEDWITLSIFWLFFSGADAFVAAHLQDFDEHIGVLPAPGGGTQLQYRIPVGP